MAKQGLMDRHYFLLRRLHSLSGIVPIGVFLMVHLFTNSSLAWGKFMTRGGGEGLSIQEGGAAYFQHEVSYINEQVPHLLLIELSLWGAIAFHSIFGVMIAMSGKRNTTRYAYQDNFRYSLQRATGYVGILFIFYHVATLRWGWDFLVPGGTKWDHQFSASTLAAALRGGTEGITPAGVAVSIGYFFGITALVFHFANGLWTAAITWGLTVSEGAQKRWGGVCFVLGCGLMLAAWSSLAAAVMLDPAQARTVEEHIILEGDDIGRVKLERLEAKEQASESAESVDEALEAQSGS
ncbi:MAG: succinate dehydrogenase / fumarate reductase cytochrome b subunit [Phycisphaerales bacterium]